MMNEGTEKRILSLGGTGAVREFELFYRVSFRIKEASDELWGPVQMFEGRRDFTHEEACAEFGQAMSLFASQRLLEINIPTGKPGLEGSKVLQALAASPLPDTVTVIILPKVDWRDAKSAWYLALQQNSVFIELNEIGPAQLPQWIANRLAQQKQSTDAETLTFIANQVEGNLLAAHQEIQKLGLLYPQGALAAEDVRAAVLNVSRFDAVQLGEAVLTGDIDRTVR
ncbi:MAG: DNA polymerase III subunit delta, partial [Methylophilaceae bacterium]|nr:DNA polymerase III subunit delta [Methylophilaceae bacterium]